MEEILHKACTKCGIDKPLSEYHNDKYRKDGKACQCKVCQCERRKNDRIKNIVRETAYGKNYRITHKEQIAEREKKYRDTHRDEINKQRRERKNGIPMLRFMKSLGSRFSPLFRGIYTPKKLIAMLGCDGDFFIKYIESQWEEGMSWDNYGTTKDSWNIDHIIPCAYPNKTNEDEVRKVCHYTNLRPMWHVANVRKGSLHNGIKYKYTKES